MLCNALQAEVTAAFQALGRRASKLMVETALGVQGFQDLHLKGLGIPPGSDVNGGGSRFGSVQIAS